ncbi:MULTISPECIES: hypothetical protein [Tsukamurella]|uniref:SHOCT domain-containing protein n=2 Tax=Tsukamurella TaxID=2060 RepID=A0A5C5RY43_9ACTN|nr:MULTISPECIES: hypothetical protein [Tsukamurella]NMD56756.1 hypothetical protein [Tsukamurella columbiensis]TWS27350.1 hypothetical protein FK530_18670 [Tsukamurella conjunctivitidis]
MYPDTPQVTVESPGVPGFFIVGAVIFAVFFLSILTLIIVTGVKNYRAAKEKGQDIFTLETDLQVQALQSRALGAERTIEERLAEIEDLAERGVIDADERAAARAKILADG